MKKTILLVSLLIIVMILTVVFARSSINRYELLKKSKVPFIVIYANVEQLDLRSKYDIPQTMSDACIDSVWAIKTRLGIPEHIPFNLLMKESCFDSNALSKDGCFGYMQLNPKYFKPCKSNENIRQGLYFLKEQYDRLGSWKKALIYYNSGENNCSDPKLINYILNHKKQ